MKKICLLLCMIPFFHIGYSEEIFLSVTKEGITQQFVPSNTVVLTKEDIEKTNAKNVGELLEMFTVYDLSRYGGIGSEKTLRLRNSTSGQVLVLINNIPLNSAAKGAFNLSLLSIDVVEKIEILTGNSSALYGANAVAGVVNIITKSPKKEKPEIDSIVSYGNLNTYKINTGVDYNSYNWGTKISVGNQHSDGWRENSDYNSLLGYVNFTTLMLNGKLNFNVLINNSKLGIPGAATVPVQQWNGSIEKKASTPNAKQYDDIYLVGLSYEDKILTTKLSFEKNKLEYDNSNDTNIWLQDHTISNLMTINFLNTVSLPYKFFVSLNYNYSQVDQQYILKPVDDFKKDVSNLGVALQKEFKYEDLYFIPTLRWDNNSLFGNKFSPQVIFVYNVYQIKTSFMVGTSWRAPTFLDLYWPDQVWVKGNPNLIPEESYSIDIAVEKKFREISFVLNPFYRYLKDQIRWYPENPQDPWSAWLPSNVDETVVQGVEMKVNFLYNKIFDNKISVLLSDNRIKKKGEEDKGWQKQAYSPLVTICYNSTLDLPYDVRLVNIAKYVDTQYSKDDEKGVKLNSYLLWNIRVEKKIGSYLRTYLQINDLFDQKGVNREGYPQQGRNYEAGVNIILKI